MLGWLSPNQNYWICRRPIGFSQESYDFREQKVFKNNVKNSPAVCKTGNSTEGSCDKSDNKGNFREILSLLLSESSSLQRQFDNAPSNAKYHSKEIQNDLLEAAAAVVLHSICRDVQSAHYFSLIADECRDIGRTEQLSLCLRFVSRQDSCIKERFVGFTDVHELDASSLAGEIMRKIGELGLESKKCVSQCYDGASVMSGHLAGVQAIVQRTLGHECLYVHCYAHRLNLVLVNIA